MNIRERLKLADENVAFGADKTWNGESDSIRTSSMDLFVRKSHIQIPRPMELRPRTVKDCIPDSKLAQYSNYEYSNSRELSYTSEDFKKLPETFRFNFKDEIDKEPWMMDEVDESFRYYTENHKESLVNVNVYDRSSACAQFHSPFMKCNSLPEYFLKLQITKDQVKKLWDVENAQTNSFKSIIVYKSPAGQTFVSEYDGIPSDLTTQDFHEFDKNSKSPGDKSIDALNFLSQSLNDTSEKYSDTSLSTPNECPGNKRLYSAVLQGYTSKNLPDESVEGKMTILRRNVSKSEESRMEKVGSIGDYQKQTEHISEEDISEESPKKSVSLNNIPKLFATKSYTSSRSVQTVPATNDVGINSNVPTLNQNSQCGSSFPKRMSPPASFPAKTSRPTNYQYPPLCMLLQQNPIQPLVLPRNSVPAAFQRSVPPHRAVQMPTTGGGQYGFGPAGFGARNNQQRFDSSTFRIRRKEARSKAGRKGGCPRRTNNGVLSSASSALEPASTAVSEQDREMEELVKRTVDLVLDDSNVLPISRRQSDELEREALEQYMKSCEDDFQELERQAAEEYDNCSENCESPPNLESSFGGLFKVYKFCFVS